MENKSITATKKWINDVVIGFNFCPFASKVFLANSIYYQVNNTTGQFDFEKEITKVIGLLNAQNEISTAFIIFENNYKSFEDYNNMLHKANSFLIKNKWHKKYQIASFHPEYIFANASDDDASNYTNRSPYPMLHLLREEMVSAAVDFYKNVDEIPKRNIAFAKEKGVEFMRKMLAKSFAE